MDPEEAPKRGRRLSTNAGPHARSFSTGTDRARGTSRGASRAASITRGWQEDADAATLNSGRTRVYLADVSGIPKNFIRLLLGINPFKTSYFSLYRPIKDTKSRLILFCAVAFAIAAGVPLPIIGVIFSKIIDSFPPPEDELRMRLVELIGVAIAYFVITWIWSSCWGIVGEKVSKGMREALVRKLLGMDLAYYDVHSPDLTNVLTGETQTIQAGSSEKVGLFIQAISYFVAAFTVGFILNAQLTGVLFAAVIPSTFLVVSCGTTAASRLSKKANAMSEKASGIAEGAINAIQIVQAFGSARVLTEQHRAFLRKGARTGLKRGIVGACMLASVYFIAYAANALAFWKGSRLVGETGAGTVYAVVFLILDASFVIGQFGPFIQSLALAASAGGRVLEIIDRSPPSIDVYSEEGRIIDGDFSRNADVEFENVTFVYPARPTMKVVDSIKLRFGAGTSTAIVGMSGSGKSTLASLILRFYDPTSGSIRLGGHDLRDLQLRSLRSQLALVDQDPMLFSGTILNNISSGILDKSQLSDAQVLERCIHAATEANCGFIANLPTGILTQVSGAGGTQLSGGQKQRICLARAIVRNPAVLVLDEPTSSLDATSEALILQTLKTMAQKGCTIIMIAHRLSTINFCSDVIVMKDGSILEQGPVDTLAQADGHYARLVEAQAMERHESTAPPDESPSSSSDDEKQADIKARLHEASTESDMDLAEDDDVRQQLSAIALIRRCLSVSRPERAYVLLGIFASMISGSLVLGESVIFGRLVDILNTQSSSPGYLDRVDFFCLMFFIVALVALAAYSTSGIAFGYVSEQLIMRTKTISLETVLRQDLGWFSSSSRSTHSLIATINHDSGRLSGLSGIILGTLFSVFTSVIGGIILAHAVAWKIAIVLLASVPVMLLAGYLRLRILAKFEQRQETVYSDAAALASEACTGIRTISAFGQEPDVLDRYHNEIKGPYQRSFRFILGGNIILAFSLAITYFVYALAYYWGARQVRNGNYQQRDFFTVLPALLFSAQAAGQMFSLAPEIARAGSAAASVFALHDERPSIHQGPEELAASARGKSPSEKCSSPASSGPNAEAQLVLDHVSLSYSGRPDALALRDVNLSVAKGEFIGVVGPSGAGKSTFISLLERFYDPTSGSLLIDGVDCQTLPIASYRARLALVPQEPNLFPGSISFNISLGARPGQMISQGDIEAVCKLVNIDTFIMSLPEGYQTECGSNGSQLSGGQKQRIAIARALIRDPEVLLLDEATSALDGHSEREVQEAVAAAKERGTTIIVVAHRISTIAKADRVVVLDHGQVVELGPPSDLIAKGGMYSNMVLQASGQGGGG